MSHCKILKLGRRERGCGHGHIGRSSPEGHSGLLGKVGSGSTSFTAFVEELLEISN